VRVEASRAGGVRRRGLGFGAAFLTGMLVLLVVTLIAGLIFVVSPGGASTAAATFLKAQPGSLRWDGKHQLNILFASLSRPSGPASSMMIVSYDPSTDSVSTLAVPRNLWVTVPGSGQADIADAYSNGGVSTLLRTVESVTHLVIPYYVVMAKATVARWIDALGGVTVRVDAPLGRTADGHPVLTPGKTRVSGVQALTFALSRGPYDTNDSFRLLRQQSLFKALMHHDLLPQNLFRIPQVLTSLGTGLQTNFPYNQVPDLANRLSDVPARRIRTDLISTTNGTASSYNATGQNVLLPDRQRIPSLVGRLFPEERIPSAGKVAVLNGSGISGQAAGLATWLAQARIPIGKIASAPSYNFTHTQIWVGEPAAGSVPQVARSLSALLQAPMVRHKLPPGNAAVAVVIGQDYQDPTQQ
jgi:LCP family protein required for cell wall assembly